MIHSADPDPSRDPDSFRGALIRPEGPDFPLGTLLCPTRSDPSRGALVRSRGSQLCPAGPVLGRIRALSAWAQSQGWHMDPLGPQSSLKSIFFKFQGPAGQIRVPQNRSAPDGTNQGPAARTRDPKGESGPRKTD